MAVRLLLDVGNTRIKWMTVNESGPIEKGHWTHQGKLLSFFNILTDLQIRPDQVVVASVVDTSLKQKIIVGCQKVWGLAPTMLSTNSQACGVTSGYRTPTNLGIDRWLGVIAAYNMGLSPCFVIDCGTAFTIDMVDAKGRHLGGFILPGVILMQQVLKDYLPQFAGIAFEHVLEKGFSFNSGSQNDEESEVGEMPVDEDSQKDDFHPGIPTENGTFDTEILGKSTSEAIVHGAHFAVIAILSYLQLWSRQINEKMSCVVTGGSIRNIEAFLPKGLIYDPNLVLKGMWHVLKDQLE